MLRGTFPQWGNLSVFIVTMLHEGAGVHSVLIHIQLTRNNLVFAPH